MGGGDEAPLYPTDAFVQKQSKTHYHIPVRSQHWQLRSLISVERRNILYFPGGTKNNHILKLDTDTNNLETVRILSFSPRCLVAKNGWVCCGGETGEFTAVRLDRRHEPGDLDMQLDLDPDARLPLSLDHPMSESSMPSLLERAASRSKLLMAKSMKLVRDRVNCITLWFPPVDNPPWDGAHSEPVAVLANNDKTVAIVSLNDFEDNEKIDPLHTLTYPDFVNRALISPDGRLLIAILDDPYLYVHERIESTSGGQKQYKWEYRDSYLLKSQRRNDVSQSRGSFAACFSNSGAYLAVGTQYGTISIFDVSGFTDRAKNPFITSFQSSRPETLVGAIRDMAFSPGPYDLLAWTEDRARVGIADIRNGFIYRQHIDIGDKEDGGQQIRIFDGNAIDPRLLRQRSDRDDRSPNGFATTASTSDRLRDDRPRYDSPLAGRESSRTESPSLESSPGLSRAIDLFLGSTIDRAAARAERDQEANGSSQRLPAQNAASTTPGDPPIPRSNRSRRSDWGLHRFDDLEALYSLAYGSPSDPIRNDNDNTNNNNRRDRTPFVAFLSDREFDNLMRRGSSIDDREVHQVPPQPDNTSGLAWSEDGRLLFVGAQNGIYEYRVNIMGRKLQPSITLR
ncbi:unnamed protein product [Parascedosporium putredinis]|uniref:DUF2415 domain-containing protein n=1 Tax=Parascedosporium putredinis TaxID=1442378 RepID=A0A9P1H503_9PEZI|nr:unnamed protein product [Parascedosporium putredinis]CAI7998779.1 unnamed protein product [Parascedosporium putredinis]